MHHVQELQSSLPAQSGDKSRPALCSQPSLAAQCGLYAAPDQTDTRRHQAASFPGICARLCPPPLPTGKPLAWPDSLLPIVRYDKYVKVEIHSQKSSVPGFDSPSNSSWRQRLADHFVFAGKHTSVGGQCAGNCRNRGQVEDWS